MLFNAMQFYAMLSNAKQRLVMLHLTSMKCAKDLRLFFYEQQTTQQDNSIQQQKRCQEGCALALAQP